VARRATAIRQAREQAQEPVIVLDGGDSLFRGGEWATLPDPDQGALLAEAMNAMGYEAIALGERELYAPLSTVQARLGEIRFPILSANVDATGVLSNVRPYLLRQAGDHTVAIVGVTSDVATKRLSALGLDLTVRDPIAAVSKAVGEARKQADIVILLSNVDRASAEALALAVPGIDAIVGLLDGEQREPAALPGAEGQVILHASASRGEYLGVLTLRFDEEGQVTSYEGHLLALTDRYADDPQIVEIFHRYASQP
jgi:5'-nucleotidase/UDP-sugar diphosphatase